MTSRGRVLYVSEPTTEGVAQCLTDWTSGLVRRGWNVSLACPPTGWLAQAAQENGVHVYQWQASNVPDGGLPSEVAHLRAIIKRSNPQVVHLNGAKAGFVGRWYLRGKRPTAFSPHSWAIEAASGPKATAGLCWERMAARWTDIVLAVSAAEARSGRALGIRTKYEVTRNGVDLDDVAPSPDRMALRSALGIPRDGIAVVCVGRMHRQKGQEVLTQAWPEIASAGDNRKLYLVGDGPLLESRRASNTRDDVRFVGQVSRPQALSWMQAADLVVVPSHWEGMALVPLESLAMGTPVIASDVTGAREAIGLPECGTVVAPGDPTSLARAVNTWLAKAAAPTHQEERERQLRRLWLAEHFDVEETIERISDVLEGLATNRSGGTGAPVR